MVRWKIETKTENFIWKDNVKDLSRDGLGIVDGSDVVYLRCSKEVMFFKYDMWVGDWWQNELCIELYFRMSYQFMLLVCCYA